MSTIINANGSPSEARIAKALAHPLRARILQRLGERTASPGDLAVELSAPLGVVSYHVRMLRDYECVELVRTAPRRGALQHFYRAVVRPGFDDAAIGALPVSLVAELAGATAEAIVTDITKAAKGGALAAPDAVVTRQELELDEKGQRKLKQLLDRTHAHVLAIAGESRARIDAAGGQRVRSTLAIQHFAQPEATMLLEGDHAG